MSRILLAVTVLGLLSQAARGRGAALDPERPTDLEQPAPVSRVWLMNFRNFGHGNAFALAPDGKMVATANGNVINLFQATRNQYTQPRTIMIEDGNLYQAPLAFSGDGKTLVTTPAQYGQDATVRFIDVAAGKEIRQIDNDQPFWSLALSADGRRLALGGQQGRVEVWDAASGDEIRILQAPLQTLCQVLAFAPDGKMVAVAGFQQPGMAAVMRRRMMARPGGIMPGQQQVTEAAIYLLEVASGKVRHELHVRLERPGPNQVYYAGGGPIGVAALAFAPDGKLLAAGGVDQAIHLWDLATGHELPPLAEHQGPVLALAFTPDGKRLVSFDAAGLKLTWSVSRLERPVVGKLAPLGDQEFEDLWTDLAESDTFHTYRAVRHLVADPQRALALLQRHLKPVPPGDPERLRRLVNDLQSPNAGVRRKAMGALRKEGEAALGALAQQGAMPGGPVPGPPMPMQPSQAVPLLMQKLERQYATPERTRSLKAVEVLEQIGKDGARQLLAGLAKGAAGAALTVAAREALDKLSARNQRPSSPAGADPGLPDLDGVRKNGLTAAQCQTVWRVLASDDAAQAYQALRLLRAAPKQNVALLSQQLRPVTAPDPQRIPRLIADLDSNAFPVREQAARELDNLGELAEPALRAALAQKPSLEARRRLEQLLGKRQQAILPAELLRAVRAVEVLEQIGTPEAGQVLRALAKGAPEAVLTGDARAAVERLDRRAALTR